MAKNLRYFETNTEYQAANLVFPSVSYVEDINKVIYDPSSPTPPPFQGKWKNIKRNGDVISAECDASSAITGSEVTAAYKVEIGNCVTTIGDKAFYTHDLAEIKLSNSVRIIGNDAFANSKSLTSIVIPNSVTTIGNFAFRFCNGLTTCTIGSGVTSIGKYAFGSCRSLTSITVNATTPPTLGNNVFYSINDCPIYVPSGSVNTYKAASGWSDYASRIYPIS